MLTDAIRFLLLCGRAFLLYRTTREHFVHECVGVDRGVRSESRRLYVMNMYSLLVNSSGLTRELVEWQNRCGHLRNQVVIRVAS